MSLRDRLGKYAIRAIQVPTCIALDFWLEFFQSKGKGDDKNTFMNTIEIQLTPLLNKLIESVILLCHEEGWVSVT